MPHTVCVVCLFSGMSQRVAVLGGGISGVMVCRLVTSSTGLVSSSPALAGSIDTGLLLIAMLKAGHVH